MKRLFKKADPRISLRLKIFVPLLLLGLMLPFCLGEIKQQDYTYLLLTDKKPQAIFNRPEKDQTFDGLQIKVDDYAGDAQLQLDAGQEIKVDWNGKTYTATTRRETVDNLLRRLEIEPADEDMIILDTKDGLSISVDDEIQIERKKTVETKFKTKKVRNPLLEKGTKRVKRKGKPGTIVKTYMDTYRLGKVADTELIGQTKDTAVTQIVEYGSLVYSVDRDDYIVEQHSDKDGGGYLSFASGDTMAYDAITTCNATAYSGGVATASGYPVGVGNIAVDPSVFPYGTRMYVETTDGSWVYGMAVARDTGGAIKGHKLDLWFTSYGEACSFGRHDCTVYVLS